MNIRRDGLNRCISFLMPTVLGVIMLILIFAVLSVLFLFNFGGAGDWTFYLPGGYEIWRMNGSHIYLIDSNGNIGESTKIRGYITSFCYNDSFIGIQQIEVDDKAGEIPADSTINYYLVDVKEERVYGPFSEEDYLQLCDSMNTQLPEWIATVPAPEGADFS